MFQQFVIEFSIVLDAMIEQSICEFVGPLSSFCCENLVYSRQKMSQNINCMLEQFWIFTVISIQFGFATRLQPNFLSFFHKIPLHSVYIAALIFFTFLSLISTFGMERTKCASRMIFRIHLGNGMLKCACVIGSLSVKERETNETSQNCSLVESLCSVLSGNRKADSVCQH